LSAPFCGNERSPSVIQATFKTSLWSLQHTEQYTHIHQKTTHTNKIKLSLNSTWKISSSKPIYEWSYFCNTVSHFTHFWRFLNWISFSAAVISSSGSAMCSVLSLHSPNKPHKLPGKLLHVLNPANTHHMKSMWCTLIILTKSLYESCMAELCIRRIEPLTQRLACTWAHIAILLKMLYALDMWRDVWNEKPPIQLSENCYWGSSPFPQFQWWKMAHFDFSKNSPLIFTSLFLRPCLCSLDPQPCFVAVLSGNCNTKGLIGNTFLAFTSFTEVLVGKSAPILNLPYYCM